MEAIDFYPTSFHVFFLPHFEASENFSACHFKEICENSRNGPHVHPFSALSGAYYVDCGHLDQRCCFSTLHVHNCFAFETTKTH